MLYPIHQPFSGTVAADGTFSYSGYAIQTAGWALPFVTAEQAQMDTKGNLIAVGNPRWSLSIDKNKAAYGTGSSAELGPRLLPPKSTISVNMSNGIPGAIVNGIIQGSYSNLTNTSEVMANYTPSINPIAINSSSAPLETTIANGTSLASGGNATMTVPVGTTYLMIAMFPNSATSVNLHGITGAAVDRYYTETFANQFGSFRFVSPVIRYIPVDQLIDTTLQFDNVGPGAINNLVISARTDPIPAAANKDQAPVEIYPIPATSIGSNATLNIIPSSTFSGRVYRLLHYSLFQDGANATGRFDIQDTSANLLHSLQCIATRGLLGEGDFDGPAIIGGAGIQILNAGTAASFLSGVITVRQQIWPGT